MPLVNKNTKKINNVVYEPKDFDFNNPKKQKQVENMVELLGYKGLTRDVHNYIAMKNGWFSELVVLEGLAASDLTYELNRQLVKDAGAFFNALSNNSNVTFFGYSYRVNTEKQQASWNANKTKLLDAIHKEKNPRRRLQLERRLEMVNSELKRQVDVEKYVWAREYLMQVFAPSKAALENEMHTIKVASERSMAPFRFRELSKTEKLDRMYTLNNPGVYLNREDN